MAIKVTLGEAKPQPQNEYPKLMQHKDDANLVILFHKENSGTWLSGKDIGYRSDGLYMANFVDYNEPVTLQNL